LESAEVMTTQRYYIFTLTGILASVMSSGRVAQAAEEKQAAEANKTVRTFHIGNSLTDTVDGWLAPVAQSAGRKLDFHRFTIPGAPTDWLWDHPGTGFGDSRYAEAFGRLAPIDHIFTQPFAGHNRSIPNEADYSARFFNLCRKQSPDVQAWLYVQWPGPDFKDGWAQGQGATVELKLKPAKTWQEGVANHTAYTEAVARLINKTYEGKPVRIVPGGAALAALKTEIDAGRVPGLNDFFAEIFADDIHLKPWGRYMIALVHYACIFRESPEGKVSALKTGLTDHQAAIFQRIAWETVRSYPWTAGSGEPPVAPPPEKSHWFHLQPANDTFEPSVLDCSGWVEAPTGKHGFVTVKADRFVFEDGTPARFYGAQMDMFDRKQLDYTIRRMRRQGINITRMHGLDYTRRDAQTSFDYDPDKFERLDYLLSKLAEHGIYMILDLHYPLVYRFKPGDNLPGLPQGGPAPYTQFFNESAAAIMHRRMIDFFTHFNPYTKKRYADDPTIAMVEILNEDSLFWGEVPATFRTELEEKFAAWLRRKYRDDAGLSKAWTTGEKSPFQDVEGLGPGERIGLLRSTQFTEEYFRGHPEHTIRGQDQMRFYLELEQRYWADSRAALRKAGVRVPISASNWQGHGFTTRVHMLGQAKLDYIDRHGYWDHPQGQGNLKWNIKTSLFHNQPMVKAVKADQDQLIYLGVGNLVIEKAWEQVLDLPMTVSEWNSCVPNQYSLDGPGLMTAYGLLQGWDGPLQFGYFSPDWKDRMGSGSFDLFGNPPHILQFPALAAMWHRRDVQEAEIVAESVYDPEGVFALTDDRKPAPIAAALVGKVGYRFVEENRPPVRKDISPYWDARNLVARSITGELTWNASQGVVCIDTARTQAVIGFLSQGRHAMKQVTLESPNEFGAVYVTAMDGDLPLESARRILVTAVGPAKNTGMEYEATSQKSRLSGPYWRLKNMGEAPVLLQSVTGEIRIRSQHANQFKAWILDVVGKRIREIPLQAQADAIQLKLNAEYDAVYYELSVP